MLVASMLVTCSIPFHGISAEPVARQDLHPDESQAVLERVKAYEGEVKRRLLPYLHAAGIAYPPRRVLLLGLKQERRLELYAGPTAEALRFVRDYPILAASGGPGPKLRAGDRQVPEGIYRVTALNPSSRFHLALGLDYPNAFDRAVALREGRADLGGDIFIHGGTESIGCLAIGDRSIEELFVLTALAGTDNVDVVLSPRDFRQADMQTAREQRAPWVDGLYAEISRRINPLSRNSD